MLKSLHFFVLMLLCLAILVIPWPFAGNWPFVRTALLALATLTAAFAALTKAFDQNPIRPPLIWLFMLVGVAYSLFQFIPDSAAWLSQIIEVPDSSLVGSSSDSISVYPAISRERFVELICGVTIFVVTCCLVTGRKSVKAVMMVSVLTGVLVGFFGIVQNLSWNGKIFWVVELVQGGLPFGSFVNKNNAGGFLLASFSASVFFLAFQVITWHPFGMYGGDYERESNPLRSQTNLSFWSRVSFAFSGLQTQHLYALTAIIFIGVAIVATLSRGAALALLISIFSSVLVLTTINRWVAALAIAACCSGAVLMVYSEQSTAVVAKANTMKDLSEVAAPRLLHWQDALPYVQDHAILGSGLGTYQFMYLPHQERYFQKWFRHAENVYLETLGELGVIGLAALLLSIGIFLISSWKLFRSANNCDRALGVMGISLMTGQAVACFFDFGIYQPANTVIVAILAGTVIGRSSRIRKEALSTNKYLGSRFVTCSILLLLSVACLFSTYESFGVETRRKSRQLMDVFRTSEGSDEQPLIQMENILEQGVKIRPDDSDLQYRLGELELAKFRMAMTQRFIDDSNAAIAQEKRARETATLSSTEVTTQVNNTPNSVDSETRAELTPLTQQEAWELSPLSAVHRMAHFAARVSPTELEAIRNYPEVKNHLHKAWEHYSKSEERCNALQNTTFRLAQLSIFVDGNASEESHILKSIERSPNSPILLFNCGLLHSNAGRIEQACAMWKKCLELSREFEEQIVEIGRLQLPMRAFFETVLPQKPSELLRIAKRYFKSDENQLVQKLLLVHTRRLLEKSDQSVPEKQFTMGEIQRLSGDHPAAVKSYVAALEKTPNHHECRLALAKSYQQIRAYDESLRHLRILEMTPGIENPALYARLTKQVQREQKKNQTNSE